MDMYFISIKKHEMESWLLLYFQVGESPVPLNIPTPTPAPKYGQNNLGDALHFLLFMGKCV